MPAPPPGPSYDLAEVQRLVQEGSFRAAASAFFDAMALGFDKSDIVDCIAQLTAAEFYKTMPAEKCPGLMQDVYRPTYLSKTLYVKVQLRDGLAWVISFKKL